jgi:DNA-binding winged helix-turn-helix (wHTH) protein
MNNQEQTIYRFGPFELHAKEQRLLKAGQPVSIGYKQLEILICLIERSNEIVSRQELIEKVWSGVHLDPNNLLVHIHNLRKVLGDSPDEPQYIRTMPGKGYSFSADIKIQNASGTSTSELNDTETSFSETIKKLSPRFIFIYDEAKFAEQHNLYEICGTGYRKALEVFLKEYALMRFPNEEKITAQPLLDCVRDYIHNKKIKHIAAQVAWLGNWESHCLYKWESKSISDLKVFINLIVREVESELEIEKLQSGNSDKDSKRRWWQL